MYTVAIRTNAVRRQSSAKKNMRSEAKTPQRAMAILAKGNRMPCSERRHSARGVFVQIVCIADSTYDSIDNGSFSNVLANKRQDEGIANLRGGDSRLAEAEKTAGRWR